MTDPVTYRTDDSSRWGAGKGSNLTPTEIDRSFYGITVRLVTLETSAPQPDQITQVSLDGEDLSFTLASGTILGPVTLPVAKVRWRNDWTPSTSYLGADIFKVDTQGIYLVLLDHTSAATFDEAATDGSGNPLYYKMFGFSGLSGAVLSDLGDVAIASLADKDWLVYDLASGKWKNQRPKYGIGVFAPGLMSNSQVLLYHKFPKAVTIPANFGAYLGFTSEAGGSANATGSIVITANRALAASPNSFSQIGTITIAASGVSPTFATSGGTPVNFAQGDVLQLKGPATADATFSDFYATLTGFET